MWCGKLRLSGSILPYILCFICGEPPPFGYNDRRAYKLSSLCTEKIQSDFYIRHGVVIVRKRFLDMLRLDAIQYTYNCYAEQIASGETPDIYECARRASDVVHSYLVRKAMTFIRSFPERPKLGRLPRFDYRRIIATMLKLGLVSTNFELRGKYIQLVFFKKIYRPKKSKKKEIIVMELSMLVPVPITTTKDDVTCVGAEQYVIENADLMCERAVARYMNGWVFSLKSYLTDLCGPCEEDVPTFMVWMDTWETADISESRCGYSEVTVSRGQVMGIDVVNAWCNEHSFINDIDRAGVVYIGEVTKYKDNMPHSRYVYSFCGTETLEDIDKMVFL